MLLDRKAHKIQRLKKEEAGLLTLRWSESPTVTAISSTLGSPPAHHRGCEGVEDGPNSPHPFAELVAAVPMNSIGMPWVFVSFNEGPVAKGTPGPTRSTLRFHDQLVTGLFGSAPERLSN